MEYFGWHDRQLVGHDMGSFQALTALYSIGVNGHVESLDPTLLHVRFVHERLCCESHASLECSTATFPQETMPPLFAKTS